MEVQCKFCSAGFDPEDTYGMCPTCHMDIGSEEPYLMEGFENESSREWTSGSSEAQKANVLNARKTLDYLRKNPKGATKDQIRAAGVTPSLDILRRHGLVTWSPRSSYSRNTSPPKNAIWKAL